MYPLDMTPDALKSFVQELVGTLNVDIESVEVATGHRTLVAITSPDSQKLIGKDGETLRALNTIAKRIVENKHGEDATNFLIDVNNFYEHQMEQVRANARMLAQRARLFKHDVELPPQSAYERLVVHELFANDPEIMTESAGEGKFRHIVLKYKVGGTATV
ncbi:MAG TPA: R3H domain-containing nucleic acid-binding protein [Candidatus Paceibacterota bacterium]